VPVEAKALGIGISRELVRHERDRRRQQEHAKYE